MNQAVDTIIYATGAALYAIGGAALFIWLSDRLITYILKSLGVWPVFYEALWMIQKRRKELEDRIAERKRIREGL